MIFQREHPLLRNEHWLYSQPEVGFRSYYRVVSRETGQESVRKAVSMNSCREGLIHDTRTTYLGQLTNWNAVREARGSNWQGGEDTVSLQGTGDVDFSVPLEDPKHRTALRISWHPNWFSGDIVFSVADFLGVCDRILGPVCILLSVTRPAGKDWWRTSSTDATERMQGQDYTVWYGSDNWLLTHPTTMSIATGLYRQCFHLCNAGVAREILKSVSEAEVAKMMSTNSQKLAILMTKKVRSWIEVPPAPSGNRRNYPFPLGLWRRLMHLQRGIRRHGYESVLGEDFHTSWRTTNLDMTAHTGVFSFWGDVEGDEDGGSTRHRHLMEQGAPRRRRRLGGK